MGHRPLTREADPYVQIDEVRRRVERMERRYRLPVGHYAIKCFADRGALDGNLPDSAIIVENGDQKFDLFIPPRLNEAELTVAEAGISAANGSDLEIEIINIGPDPSSPATTNMLDSVIVIPAGDFVSFTPGSDVAPTLIADPPDNVVASGDWVRINIVSGGGGTAEGLEVVLDFDL